MRTPALLLASVGSLLVACHAPVAGADSPPATTGGSPFHYSHALAAPATVQLVGIQGAIEAAPSEDGVLDVRAVITGRDPSRMKVVVREDTGGVAVCVLFAQDSPDDCRLGAVQRRSHPGDHGDTDVRLIAQIPRGLTLVAETLDGAITARGLTGPVRASTLNGDVHVSTTGTATAKTANGAIEASFATPPTEPLSFETSNGRVTVDLPAGTNAAIDASTANGQIQANFPMTLHTLPMGVGPKEGHAQLGQGGPTLQARTVNGDVVLRRGG